MKNNKIFNTVLIVIIVVLTGFISYNFGTRNNFTQNDGRYLIEHSSPNVISDNNTYITKNTECKIGGTKDGGDTTWDMNISLVNNNPSYPNSISFVVKNKDNTIDSYLVKNKNIATESVMINNILTSNGYSTKPYHGLDVTWNNIENNNDTFSGEGYIKINYDIKPNEGICNGTETVNQKLISPSDPEYKRMCPSPIIPSQNIYFKCSNGIINRNPGVMMR